MLRFYQTLATILPHALVRACYMRIAKCSAIFYPPNCSLPKDSNEYQLAFWDGLKRAKLD